MESGGQGRNKIISALEIPEFHERKQKRRDRWGENSKCLKLTENFGIGKK